MSESRTDRLTRIRATAERFAQRLAHALDTWVEDIKEGFRNATD